MESFSNMYINTRYLYDSDKEKKKKRRKISYQHCLPDIYMLCAAQYESTNLPYYIRSMDTPTGPTSRCHTHMDTEILTRAGVPLFPYIHETCMLLTRFIKILREVAKKIFQTEYKQFYDSNKINKDKLTWIKQICELSISQQSELVD